jgi:hypothetical protein
LGHWNWHEGSYSFILLCTRESVVVTVSEKSGDGESVVGQQKEIMTDFLQALDFEAELRSIFFASHHDAPNQSSAQCSSFTFDFSIASF